MTEAINNSSYTIIKPDFVPEDWPCEADALTKIGIAAGTAYNAPIDAEHCEKRVLKCIADGHLSVLEHLSLSAIITTDRGTSHAIVRHRHCAFTQASTIYTKYKQVGIVERPLKDPVTGQVIPAWTEEELAAIKKAADTYINNVQALNLPAGLARDVLPTCTATTVYMTANLSEWLYISQRRTEAADSVRMHVFVTQLNKVLLLYYPKIYAAWLKRISTHPIV